MKLKIIKFTVLISICLIILIMFTSCLFKNYNSKPPAINQEQAKIIDTAKNTIAKKNNIVKDYIVITNISDTGENTWNVYYKTKLSKDANLTPAIGSYCVHVAKNINSNKYSAIIDKNSSDELTIFKNVPYNCFYAGFVLEKENRLPFDTLVINTLEEWKDFRNNYLSQCSDMKYLFNTSEPVDFNKQAIIYDSKQSTKDSLFSKVYFIDRIELVNGKIEVNMKYSKADTLITVSNSENEIHKYITLSSVSKADLKK